MASADVATECVTDGVDWHISTEGVPFRDECADLSVRGLLCVW